MAYGKRRPEKPGREGMAIKVTVLSLSLYLELNLEATMGVSMKPILSKLINLVSLEQSHHKHLGMYGGGDHQC